MIKSRIKIGKATNSTVIGVQTGPTLDEIRRAVRQEFTDLLTLRDVPDFTAPAKLASALYYCEATGRGALGFAVNNSGVIVHPAVVGTLKQVRHLVSGATYSPETISRGNLLAAIRVAAHTVGLVPAYRPQPEFTETLFTFDEHGEECPLCVDAIALWARIESESESLIIRDGFMARFTPPRSLIGGPVLNEAREVMGVAVGATKLGFLVVQPWAEIQSCITLNVETMARTSSDG